MVNTIVRLNESHLKEIISEEISNRLKFNWNPPVYNEEEIKRAKDRLTEVIRQVEEQELPILKRALQQEHWSSFYECLDILASDYLPEIKKLANIISGPAMKAWPGYNNGDIR